MKKTPAALIVVIATIGLVSGAWAQPLPAAKAETVGMSSERLARLAPGLKGLIANERFPGAVVLVARKGKVVYFDAVGQRDPATGAPMTKDAIFRLYSMTKPFTSVAAMMLAEEGKLLLNDPISKYLPQLGDLRVAAMTQAPDGTKTYTLVPAERPITVQDLLRHTSGIAYANRTVNEHVKKVYEANRIDWRDLSAADQIDRLAKAPLAHQPGTVWEYSLSTDVLGRVVEKVSGTTLSAFLNERLFTPLKMTDTSFLVPKDKVARIARPFLTDKETGKPITLLDVTVPQMNDAGGAGSAGTTGDYARFAQMLANGGQLDGVRVLGRHMVNYMTSDHLGAIKPSIETLAVGYGFGLGFAVRKETGIYSMPGSAGEFNWGGAAGTGFWVDPKEQLVVVIMTATMPGTSQRYDRALVRQLVYQAIVE